MSSPRITDRKIAQPQQQQASVPGAVHAAAAAAAAAVQDQLGGQAPRAATFKEQFAAFAAAHPADMIQLLQVAIRMDQKLRAQMNSPDISLRLGALMRETVTDDEIIAELRDFIAKGGGVAKVRVVGSHEFPSLLAALQHGRIKLALALVQEFGCDITVTMNGKLGVLFSLIMSKGKFDKTDALKKMIALGAPLGHCSDTKSTPFMMVLNQLDAIGEAACEPFLEEGRREHLKLFNLYGECVFHYAIRHASKALCSRLLQMDELKGLLNHQDRHGYTPLQATVRRGEGLDLIELLVNAGADLTVLGPVGEKLFELEADPNYGVNFEMRAQIIAKVKQLMQAAEEQKDPK